MGDRKPTFGFYHTGFARGAKSFASATVRAPGRCESCAAWSDRRNADGRRLTAALPDPRCELIDGARGVSMIDRPGRLAELIGALPTPADGGTTAPRNLLARGAVVHHRVILTPRPHPVGAGELDAGSLI